jgi:hypothetical protein
MRRCACAVAAVAYFSVSVALGQDSASVGGSDQTGSTGPQPLGNPLWRIPVGSLSATRERPLFSASRRPPPPQPPPAPPALYAAPSPRAELERPPLTLQGTAIGRLKDIALVLDEAAKGSVRLHVGEAAEGWRLRSVDRRAVTLEKDARIVSLSLPPPGAAPPSPPAPVSDRPTQSSMRNDAGPHSKTGGDWISIAHVLY